MPMLEWIGKDKDMDVPYRVLERKYSHDETGQHDEDSGSENMTNGKITYLPIYNVMLLETAMMPDETHISI